MKAVTFFKTVCFLLFLALVTPIHRLAAQSINLPKVMPSSSGICHDSSSGSFNRTKHYKPFNTLTNCIMAGGRLPNASTKQIAVATDEAIGQSRPYAGLYDRGEWPHWLDNDKDCQNTRHELLIKTSTKPVSFRSARQCQVLAGQWYDPYSNITFTISKDLDLDHIVPLKFAHGHGANKWSRARKALFANDTDNLILADATLNRQKGAKGIHDWLPPNHLYRCQYVMHFNRIMSKYDLAYTPSEQLMVNRLVKACDKYVVQVF